MILYLKIAIRNLQRHWRQSLAAILSISAGFIALVVFEGYIEQVRQLMYTDIRQRLMLGDVMIEREGVWSVAGRSNPWDFLIGDEQQKFINDFFNKTQEVEASSQFLRVEGMISNGKVSTIFRGTGYDLQGGLKIRKDNWYWNVLYGRPLEEAKEPSFVAGQTLAQILGCRPTPPRLIKHSNKGYSPEERSFECEMPRMQLTSSTVTGQISALDLNLYALVDGGMKEMDARYTVMPLPLAQSLMNTKSVSFVSALLKDSSRSRDFSADFDQAARASGVPLRAYDWRDHRTVGEMYRKTTSLLHVFRNFVIVIILCISTLSVLNTMVKIVKERTREIGTWRSLGYTPTQLTFMFSVEAVALGLVGSMIGVIVAVVASVVVNLMEFSYKAGMFVEPVPFGIEIVPQNYFFSTCILTAVCLLASVMASRGVLRKKISENLIYN